MSIFRLFSLGQLFKKADANGTYDSTIYLVTTATNEYQGLIVHQDSVALNMKDTRSKRVKILKENIIAIKIIKPPVNRNILGKPFPFNGINHG